MYFFIWFYQNVTKNKQTGKSISVWFNQNINCHNDVERTVNDRQQSNLNLVLWKVLEKATFIEPNFFLKNLSSNNVVMWFMNG